MKELFKNVKRPRNSRMEWYEGRKATDLLMTAGQAGLQEYFESVKQIRKDAHNYADKEH